ncbi:hypothetical protein DL768_008615 [Monosporascus sp. mg162]|nr:hypothetical protein DL768_008615 [Monosporascus sp. mg162]
MSEPHLLYKWGDGAGGTVGSRRDRVCIIRWKCNDPTVPPAPSPHLYCATENKKINNAAPGKGGIMPHTPRVSRTSMTFLCDRESKRIANRIAQRKFRRQRKDYIAFLERELDLCRANGSEELLQRRRQVEALRSQQAELRSLLCQITAVLQRICNSGSTTHNQEAWPQNDEWSLQPENGMQTSQTHRAQGVLPHNVPEISSTEDPSVDDLMVLNENLQKDESETVASPSGPGNECHQSFNDFQYAIQPLGGDLLYTSDMAGTGGGDANAASSPQAGNLDHSSHATLDQAYAVLEPPGPRTRGL